MTYKVYALRDVKAESYAPPFYAINHGMAIREIHGFLRGDNNVSRFPQDFSLFCIGEFDDSSGAFKSAVPVLIGQVIEFKESVNG